MTVSPCIPLEELERVAALPAGDPRRAHVAGCPRCRALLDEMALFLAPGEAADAPHVAAADARLSAFLAREIGGAPAAASAPARAAAPAPARARPDGSWFARLFGAGMGRPALAFGAIALVLTGGLALWPRLAARSPQDALRGGAPATAAITLRAAGLDARGLRLAWSAAPGADAYEVRVYSAALEEIARLNANGDTALAVPPPDLPFRAVPGQPLLVRVVARAGGAVVATSPPVPLVIADPAR